MGVFHTLCNVKLSDKHETLLLGICWNDAYLIIGLEYQCVENYHNNATHISSVVMHDVIVYMHIFLTCKCQMLFDKYDAYAESQSSYMSQMGDYPFQQTLCFFILDLIFKFTQIKIPPS